MAEYEVTWYKHYNGERSYLVEALILESQKKARFDFVRGEDGARHAFEHQSRDGELDPVDWLLIHFSPSKKRPGGAWWAYRLDPGSDLESIRQGMGEGVGHPHVAYLSPGKWARGHIIGKVSVEFEIEPLEETWKLGRRAFQ